MSHFQDHHPTMSFALSKKRKKNSLRDFAEPQPAKEAFETNERLGGRQQIPTVPLITHFKNKTELQNKFNSQEIIDTSK